MRDNRALKMSNGASVNDWLGTASDAARVAAMRLTDVRNGIGGVYSVNVAIDQLRQSLSECEDIIGRLAQSDAA